MTGNSITPSAKNSALVAAVTELVTMHSYPLTPAISFGPNPQHTGNHLTSGLVGHFPSVKLTSNIMTHISHTPEAECN